VEEFPIELGFGLLTFRRQAVNESNFDVEHGPVFLLCCVLFVLHLLGNC